MNLYVGTHKYSNKRFDMGYGNIVKSCGCPLGSKCEHEEEVQGCGCNHPCKNKPVEKADHCDCDCDEEEKEAA